MLDQAATLPDWPRCSAPAGVPVAGDAGALSAATFARVAARYTLLVLPQVRALLAGERERAAAIPDPLLRATAQAALVKRGDIEGAALFAVLAPSAHRSDTVRALVAVQSIYNYVDELGDRPALDPAANLARMHEALLTALDHSRPHSDYYAHCVHRDDGGYLHGMVEECRAALDRLASISAVAPHMLRVAGRIVAFQSLNLSERDGGHARLRDWAVAKGTGDTHGLEWQETAAACGSSLALHALIALAARPALAPGEPERVEDAYFPYVCVLHSLLDSVVDLEEDAREGRPSLLEHYPPGRAPRRLRALALSGGSALADLDDAPEHRVILAAMVGYYLTDAGAKTAQGREVRAVLLDALGSRARVAGALFRARRWMAMLARRPYG
jgi:tetraprenyl-beta-curcumene synthase